MKQKRKPKLAVWKFASCDGCQLSLLDCEDELLAVASENLLFDHSRRRPVLGEGEGEQVLSRLHPSPVNRCIPEEHPQLPFTW